MTDDTSSTWTRKTKNVARAVKHARVNCNIENGGSRIAWNDFLAPIPFLRCTERNHMKHRKARVATIKLRQATE